MMPLKIACVVFLCINFSVVFGIDFCYLKNEDARLKPDKLISKYGYPVHVIAVESDVYKLTVHRIPFGLENEDEPNKMPVILMHDIFSSSADFVNMGNRSLAFVLADMGYDVWMVNARGNTFSRPGSIPENFWDFSWHEMGEIDLPNIIDYIIDETGATKIHYIGHGQGTTVFYVMASQRPEYNEKIALMISLAPVAFNRNLPNPLVRVADSMNLFKDLLASEPHDFFSLGALNDIVRDIVPCLCDDRAMLVELCAGVLFFMYGFDSAQLDRAKVPIILSNAGAGASTKQLQHYYQLFYTDNFTQFDYGSDKNMIIYEQKEPPSYDLLQVTAPVALFYGKNDWLVSVKDVETLAKELGNPVDQYLVPFDDFNHMDFLFARDIEKLVYDRMFDLMSEYNVK